MKYGQIVISALRSVAADKLRAGLTVLGVLIGIFAVSLLVSLGAGVQSTITNEVASLGTNLVVVLPGAGGGGGAFGGATSSVSTLTPADAAAVLHVPGVRGSAPFLTIGAQLAYGSKSVVAVLDATTSQFTSLMPVNVVVGKFSLQAGQIVMDSADASSAFGSARAALGPRDRVLDCQMPIRVGEGRPASGWTGSGSRAVPCGRLGGWSRDPTEAAALAGGQSQ